MSKPTSRQPWLLYHGTTTLHLQQIRQDNALRVSPAVEKKVALTADRSVAECASLSAVVRDFHDRPGESTRPVILVLDGEALVGLRYVLEVYSDNTFGEGEFDWEDELASKEDIEPLHEVLVRIDPVPLDRFKVWWHDDEFHPLFWPPRPWILERISSPFRKMHAAAKAPHALWRNGRGLRPYMRPDPYFVVCPSSRLRRPTSDRQHICDELYRTGVVTACVLIGHHRHQMSEG